MSIPGAIYFELNKMLGFILGEPDKEAMNNYSDYVVDRVKGVHIMKYGNFDVRYEKFAPIEGVSEKYQQLIYNVLTAGYVPYDKDNVDLSEYKLFGMSFLPWNVPLQNSSGEYIKKQVAGSTYERNPLNAGNFMTILKILLPTVAAILGVRYYMKK